MSDEFEPAPFDPARHEGQPVRQRGTSSRWLGAIPLAGLLVAMALVPMPYYLLSPGSPEDVVPLIHIEDHQTYPAGHLLLTDVFFAHPNAYEAALSLLVRADELVPEKLYLPAGQTDQQQVVAGFNQMDTSKITAAVVALTGYEDYPKEHGDGALVQFVFPDLPAATKLAPGDLILSVDGTDVKTSTQLGKLIAADTERKPLTFSVRGDQGTRTEVITPTTVSGVDHPVIGVASVDNFPFPITIESGDIGGPSAGLMWTLGLIDLLTPGDLTGGRSIAGTGEIAIDGSVHPIGGAKQKVVAAERAGAAVFFCPEENAAEARSVAKGITIVPVATYADAVAYLGGPPPASPPSPTT